MNDQVIYVFDNLIDFSRNSNLKGRNLFLEIAKTLMDAGFLRQDSIYRFRFYVKYPELSIPEDYKNYNSFHFFHSDNEVLKEGRIPLRDNDGNYIFPDSSYDSYCLTELIRRQVIEDNLDYAGFKSSFIDVQLIGNCRVQFYDTCNDTSNLDTIRNRTRRLLFVLVNLMNYYICFYGNNERRLELLDSLWACTNSVLSNERNGFVKEIKKEILTEIIKLHVYVEGFDKAFNLFFENSVRFGLNYETIDTCFIKVLSSKIQLVFDYWSKREENHISDTSELIGKLDTEYDTVIKQIKNRPRNDIEYTHLLERELFAFEVRKLISQLQGNRLVFFSEFFSNSIQNTSPELLLDEFKTEIIDLVTSLKNEINTDFVLDGRKIWKELKCSFLLDSFVDDISDSSLDTIKEVLLKYDYFDRKSYGVHHTRKGSTFENLQYGSFERDLKKCETILKEQKKSEGLDEFAISALYNFTSRIPHLYETSGLLFRQMGISSNNSNLEIIKDAIEKRTKDIIEEENIRHNQRYSQIFSSEEEKRRIVIEFLRAANRLPSIGSLQKPEIEYQYFKDNAGMIREIVSGQVFYDSIVTQKEAYCFKGDYSPLILNLIKAIERYLKLVWLSDERLRNTCIRHGNSQYSRREWDEVRDCLVCSDEEGNVYPPDMGDIANAIGNSTLPRPRTSIFNRDPNQRNPQLRKSEFQREFIDKTRNGHLHIHMIDTLEEAEHFYRQCSLYFRKCLDEIKFTL